MSNSGDVTSQKRRAVLAALGAAVLAVGGGAAATAMAGHASGDDFPVVVASSGGPTLAPSSAPPSTPPGAGSSAEPPLGPIPKIASRARIAMPLDSVMTSSGDIALIETAGQLKARDCMRSLGFKSWQAGTVASPAEGQEPDLLEYLDPANVARSGYPSTLVDKPDQKDFGNAQSVAKPNPEALKAFEGMERCTAAGSAVPQGGCQSEGDREVKTDTMNLPVDPRFLAGQAKFAALHDSRMRHTFAVWSSCIRRQGLNYDDPISAQNDARWGRRTAGTSASSDERHTALIDAGCQKSINLVGEYKALEFAYQKRSLVQNRSQLARAKAIFEGWVKNAKTMIAKG